MLRRRDHPRLVGALDHAVQRGRLRALLPGVYVDAGQRVDLELRARAATAWDPDAVICGRAAARLTFWPDLATPTLEAAARRARFTAPGFDLKRRRLSPDLVLDWHGLRLTTPALTALDLALTLGGEPLDVLLRSRRSTLRDLRRALDLTPSRRGNRGRRHLLVDSRDDRARQNDLVLAGWSVLRFTWTMLRDNPEAAVLAIRTALQGK